MTEPTHPHPEQGSSQSEHAQKVMAAQDAAVKLAESLLVMGSIRLPWAMGETFNHLFHPSGWMTDASFCKRVTMTDKVRRELPVAQLHQVDCLDCLDVFTERTRPVPRG
jgi:hypothetical protein